MFDENSNKIIKILVFTIILFILILLISSFTNNDKTKLELRGLAKMLIYQNSQYIEAGYDIVDTDNPENYFVNIDGFVNPTQLGTYYLEYQLYNKSGKLIYKTMREIIVKEDDLSYISLYLNGDEEEYFFVNDYIDHGVLAYNESKDISNEVQIDSNVIPTQVGKYEVKYQIKIGNSTKELVRRVNIIDYQIKEVLNKDKSFSLTIDCQDYYYTVLPDGTKKYSKYIDYSLTKETKYQFDIYLKSGSHKEYVVDSSNFDQDGPNGTCSLTYNNGKTIITMNVTDASGIMKYSYNGLEFFGNSTVVNSTVKNVSVRAYDKNNNYQDIKCKNELNLGFKEDIKSIGGWIPCNANVYQANKELDAIVASFGYKTRGAVSGAALYLANYKHDIPYFWAGKYEKQGFNTEWGCRAATSEEDVCSVPLGNGYCEYGLDCTGFSKWSFIQAGFGSSLIPHSYQEGSKWGNFDASRHMFQFNSANMNIANLIKPGDLVAVPKSHVGIVVGVSDVKIQVAHQTENGAKLTTIMKNSGKTTNDSGSFTHFVLMDDFYKMYGTN